MNRITIFFVLLLMFFGSCRALRPNLMLKTPKDYEYSTVPLNNSGEYKLAANDVLTFQLFTNDGFKLIDIKSTTGLQASQVRMQYPIGPDGRVRFPLIGWVKVGGLTVKDAQEFLEEKYSEFYIKPYTLINVVNRRVIIFPGADGEAKVIPLINNFNNTTLIEALALAGGIPNNGKAYRIKLIRGSVSDPEVYLFDLSTIESMQKADVVLQANDIIYVEPRFQFLREILTEIAPLVSLVTSALIVVSAVNTLK